MPVSNNILQDSSKLKQSNLQKRQINEFVVDILRQINSELNEAFNNGEHYVISELSTIFEVDNLTFKEARREVLCRVIEELVQKGYRVRIDARTDICVFEIKWLSRDEETHARRQNRILDQHRI